MPLKERVAIDEAKLEFYRMAFGSEGWDRVKLEYLMRQLYNHNQPLFMEVLDRLMVDAGLLDNEPDVRQSPELITLRTGTFEKWLSC